MNLTFAFCFSSICSHKRCASSEPLAKRSKCVTNLIFRKIPQTMMIAPRRHHAIYPTDVQIISVTKMSPKKVCCNNVILSSPIFFCETIFLRTFSILPYIFHFACVHPLNLISYACDTICGPPTHRMRGINSIHLRWVSHDFVLVVYFDFTLQTLQLLTTMVKASKVKKEPKYTS